ncbi:MAG: hypothetical protein EZS28_051123 [Streblomastix strix]|uniref:Uncharacterized protein n=1 Tax=Streblomastix strix TaxID=222440 RepID=A0A5J4T755_9EUKA|nr:MAG: hypothetical protein EZS28_051123 [Streblomastix strix]
MLLIVIWLKVYTAKLRDNNQDNSESFAIDENRPFLQLNLLKEHQFTYQHSELYKMKPFAGQTIFPPTLVKKAVLLGQVQIQLIRREIPQSRTLEQPNYYQQHKIIKNN